MFGRRKNDGDPFAALKHGATYQSTPAALPELGLGGDAPAAPPPPTQSVSASVTAAPARPPAQVSPGRPNIPPSPARRVRYGSLWRVATLAIVSVVIGSAVLGASHSVHSVKIPSFTFNTGTIATPSPGGSTTGSGAAPPPRPVAYLTPHGLRAGLARVARVAHDAKLTLLRIDARTLSVYATRANGSTRQIYFSPSVTFVSPAAKPGEEPVPAASIRPGVLGALLTQLHRRFGVPAKGIDYAVVSSPSGQPARWVIFVKNASHTGYIAPLHGGTLTRI